MAHLGLAFLRDPFVAHLRRQPKGQLRDNNGLGGITRAKPWRPRRAVPPAAARRPRCAPWSGASPPVEKREARLGLEGCTWLWVKTNGTPGEHQNWLQMDVHPLQNGAMLCPMAIDWSIEPLYEPLVYGL